MNPGDLPCKVLGYKSLDPAFILLGMCLYMVQNLVDTIHSVWDTVQWK